MLAALVAAAIAGHLVWLAADSGPDHPDAYAYLAGLLRFQESFPWNGPGEAWAALGEASHGGRPPLYQLVTLPFLAVFGRTQDAAVAVNLAFLAVLAAAVFGLGRRLGGPWAGVAAAALALGYPPLVHLPRGYLPHYAAAAMVAVALLLVVKMVDERSPRAALALGVACGAGLLIHPAFAWVAALPVAAGAAWTLRDPLVLRGLLPGVALGAALAVPWYATWGRRLIELQARIVSPEATALRGYRYRPTGLPEIEPSAAWYALGAPAALSWPLAVALATGAALCLAKRPRMSGPLLLALAGGYAALALQTRLWWLYGALLLPPAAAVTAGGLATLRPRWLARTAMAATGAVAALSFLWVSWGAAGGSGILARAAALAGARDPGAVPCRLHRVFCAAPPIVTAPPVDEVLARVLADPACAAPRPCKLLVVADPTMSRTLFELRRQLGWPDRALDVRSTRQMASGVPFPFRSLLTADYVVHQDRLYPDPPPRGREYLAAASRLLRAPPPPFAAAHEEVAAFPGPDGAPVRLLHRIRRPSRAEIEAVVEAIELPAAAEVQGREMIERRRPADGR